MKPQKSSFQRLFPETSVAGYYDSFSQIITLTKYDKDDFLSLNLSNPTANDIDKISLFEHEFTHWLDHVSTLWGQRNLVLIYNALNARANENIDDFWRIKALSKSFDGDIFFDYFTERYARNNSIVKVPWRYNISSGIRFSEDGKPEYNKPILFLRFSSIDGTLLMRMPISVASILETNAINAEFIVKIALANTIEDVVEKQLNLRRIQEEMSSILYDEDLVLYTVVAHLTANFNNETNPIEAYRVASSIGTIILNLPDKIFEKMGLIDPTTEQEWNRRVKEFQNIKDKGFGFYNLLVNTVRKFGQKSYSVDNMLKSSNLPTKEDLEAMVIAEMQENLKSLIEGPFKKRAEEIINKGITIFKIRGLDGNNEDARDELTRLKLSPNLIFGDTLFDDKSFDVFQVLEKLKQGVPLSLDESYLTYNYYNRKFDEFIKACGI